MAPFPWSVPNGRAVPLRPWRIPPFRPGRHFPGLLLAGLILDAYWAGVRPGEGQNTMPLPDLTGWQLTCGPFPHPGPPYLYGVYWQTFNVYSPTCNVPQANQSIAGTGRDNVPAGARTLYMYYGPRTLPRYYAYQQYSRNPAAGVIVAPRVRPVIPAVTVARPGLLPAPPLAPVILVPGPITPLPAIPSLGPLPEENTRGYQTGAIPTTDPEDRPYSDRDLRFVYTGPDARPSPIDPERKVPVNSRAGIALTQAFKLLSLYGTSEAFISALWRALPAWARTPHARNGQKLQDLAAAWDSISIGDAFANSLGTALQTLTAGAMFGAATDALTRAFGQGPGFGLYRAWATGEFAYSTHPHSFNPHRAIRGGGSIGESQLNPLVEETVRWRYVNNRLWANRRDDTSRAVREARQRWRRREEERLRHWYPNTYRRLVDNRRRWREIKARGAIVRRRRVAWMMARGF